VNAGNGYNPSSGVFTAPVAGYYFFSVSITSDLGHSHELQVALNKNNQTIAKAHAHGDSGHLDQGGVATVAMLNAGDSINVTLESPDGASLYGDGLTTFSGFQISFK